MTDESNVRCPECGGQRVAKYGRTRSGLQKYRCLSQDCPGRGPSGGRQWVAGTDHPIDPEKKRIVLGFLAQGTHPRQIAAVVDGISLRWIYELKRRMVYT